MTAEEDAKAAAAERKRKRLEAWRKRQQEQAAAANANTNISAAANDSVETSITTKIVPKAPVKKVSMQLGLGFGIKSKKKKKTKASSAIAISKTTARIKPSFGGDEEEEKNGSSLLSFSKPSSTISSLDEMVTISTDDGSGNPSNITHNGEINEEDAESGSNNKKRHLGAGSVGGGKKKRNKWDVSAKDDMNKSGRDTLTVTSTETVSELLSSENTVKEGKDVVDGDVDGNGGSDALDKFMDALSAGAMGSVATQDSKLSLSIDVGGSMMHGGNTSSLIGSNPGLDSKSRVDIANGLKSPISGGVITPKELARLNKKGSGKSDSRKEAGAIYGPSDWESENNPNTSASETETDDEEEEKARRSFIEALKNTTTNQQEIDSQQNETTVATTHSELKSEKQRREERLNLLQLEAATAAKASAEASQPEFGRIYNDVEGGVMEEAERNLDVLNAAPDALQVLAELNKKKELKAVDHGSVEYLPIKKNLYTVPRSLANLSSDDVADRRAKLKIKVRGQGSPAPVPTFVECGLSERILAILAKQGIDKPFPVQAQCLPCIMAGRDVIGIAKTGSGKTLAYLLPMLRHIGDQPGLGPHESGPIGLVLAPARELAVQIHHVTKVFAKHLNIKSTAVYGGAGVAEQIADLKRGTHIAVATPGRMIDILTMQSGKILSLQRVSYVVMDEADRMFDMGFAPQISAILSAVRPDRQTVLFSATFPKAVETLARKSLKYPIEVMVGGRSVASDSVTQYGELIEEEDKFLRLLQLLGEHVDDEKKVIIFVDTQVRADSVFEQLIRCGYSSLSLHGGKEQEDRDSTISDFKRSDGPNVLVATSVAGRGLDVPSCACVINYAAPNHLEDYVHRVGRTGRAGNRGKAYTFCNSGDEAKFAPIVVRAMIEAGQSDNISPELRQLSDDFKEKVKRGEARYAGSGFKGKGYSYDSTELNDAQKLARLEKRQALIEAGMIDPDDDDPALGIEGTNEDDSDAPKQSDEGDTQNASGSSGYKAAVNMQANLSADILALPGMKEAILRKAGFEPPTSEMEQSSNPLSTGSNHFVEEIEINDYPREARWKVTQKETTSRLQDEFQTAVTLKGKYFDSKTQPEEGERRLYLHLEATSERVLQTCIQEIRRLLNEETLRVGTRSLGGGHRYNVLG